MKEASSVAEKEFHRSRWWWAYKWLKRFDNAGLEGLKNKHRSGWPPEVSEEASTKIRKELISWYRNITRNLQISDIL